MGAANPPVSVLDPRLARQVAALGGLGEERAEGKLEFRLAPYDPSAGKKPTEKPGTA